VISRIVLKTLRKRQFSFVLFDTNNVATIGGNLTFFPFIEVFHEVFRVAAVALIAGSQNLQADCKALEIFMLRGRLQAYANFDRAVKFLVMLH
jgi:hypothetical protein